MKSIPFPITCLLLLIGLFAPSDLEAKQLKVFAIGNSFAEDATRHLSEIAKSAGDDIEIRIAYKGGCSLQQHAEALEKSLIDPNDPEAKIYRDEKSLVELLGDEKWDIITLQQYSFISGDPATYHPYSQTLYDYLKEVQPDAELVWHQTWSYRRDADKFGRIAPGSLAKDQREMFDHSRQAYHEIADSLDMRIIPSGDALWRVDADPVWGYVASNDEFEYPDIPEQLHSMHMGYSWKKDKSLRFDTHHASTAGQYLAGLVWYGFLFEDSPERVEYTPKDMDPEFAAFLKRVAMETVRSSGM